jgi:hypothetical protein
MMAPLETPRIFTITARAGDPLPAREPTETQRAYDARVLQWAVPDLTGEEAARVIALVPDGAPRFDQSLAGTRALLALAFPGAEVRKP